jgi:hypothetical protein
MGGSLCPLLHLPGVPTAIRPGRFGRDVTMWQKVVVEFLKKDDTILESNYNMFVGSRYHRLIRAKHAHPAC